MSLWDSLLIPERERDQLRRDVASSRPTHAWLFTGAAGAPHREAAKVFAAALLCEQPDPQNRGCGECKGCVTVTNGSHADFTHFRTEATNISIEEARELVMKAQDRPTVGRWRVILVEDTERMPERTSNVLLKAIEEPPPHTIWLLTAPSPTDVLVTIRSRCRPVQLPVPTDAQVHEYLLAHGVADPLAQRAARLALGDAQEGYRLATDEQAMARRELITSLILNVRSISSAFNAAEKLTDLADQDAQAVSALKDEQERQELLALLGIREGERVSPSLRAQVRRLEEQQKRRAKRVSSDTLLRSVAQVQTVLRDALTVALSAQAPLVNEHLREPLEAFCTRRSAQQLLEDVQAVELTLRRLKTNANARLALEALMSRFVY